MQDEVTNALLSDKAISRRLTDEGRKKKNIRGRDFEKVSSLTTKTIYFANIYEPCTRDPSPRNGKQSFSQ